MAPAGTIFRWGTNPSVTQTGGHRSVGANPVVATKRDPPAFTKMGGHRSVGASNPVVATERDPPLDFFPDESVNLPSEGPLGFVGHEPMPNRILIDI